MEEKPSAKIVFSCFPNEFIKILCHGSEVAELSYLLVSEQDVSLPWMQILLVGCFLVLWSKRPGVISIFIVLFQRPGE